MNTLPQVGNFRFHSEWGVGKIRTITPGSRPDVIIDFERRPEHTASLAWIERETGPVSADGFRALYFDHYDQAQQVLRDDPVLALEMTLRDFPGGRAKTEDIKAYLGRYLTWEEWWERTQPLVKAAPHIDTSRARLREYTLRLEALSPAAEAYRSFQERRLLGDHSRAYSEARRALHLSKSDQPLEVEAQDRLLRYFEELLRDPERPNNQRLDLVFRLTEAGWLNEAQCDAELAQLITPTLRMYELDEYAQNRMLRLLERRRPSEVELHLLVSSMAGADSVIRAAVKRIIQLGEPRWILAALQCGLTQRLPDQPAESQTFFVRLGACVELVTYLPSAGTEWIMVASWFESLCAHCADKLASREQLLKFGFTDLVRLTYALYSGALTAQPESARIILAAAVNIRYGTTYLTAMFLAAQVGDGIPPTFIDAIRTLIGIAAGPQHDLLRAVVLGYDSQSDGQQIGHLVDVACLWSTHEANFDWAAGRVIELAKRLEDQQLLLVIDHLDRLATAGPQRSWHNALEAQRERAYLYGLSVLPLNPDVPPSQVFGRVDATLISAIRHLVNGQASRLEAALDEQRQRAFQLERQLANAQGELQHGKSIISEVSENRTGQEKDLKFQERYRLLRDLASAAAEFERFVVRQETAIPGLTALQLRLANLMRSNGVEVWAALGTHTAYDPAYAQVIGGAVVMLGELVEVTETGYTIAHPAGDKRILKLARVRLPQQGNAE